MEMTTALEQDTKDFSDAQDKFKSFNLQPISSQ